MKKRIIKEQAATTLGKQEVVSPIKAKHDNLLQLTLKYCKLNPGYMWVEHPDMKVEVLGRQTNDGYNYIFNKDNKVFLEKRVGNTTPNQPSVLDDCQTRLSAYQPNPLTDTQKTYMDDEAKRMGYEINRPSEAEISNGKWEEIDMQTRNPYLFTNPGGAFLYKQKNIINDYINQYPEVETALKAAGYTFTPPKATNVLFQKGKLILKVLPGEKYQTMFKTNQPTVWPTGEQSEVNIDKASLQKMAKEFKDKTPKRSDCRAAIKILFHDFNNTGDTILQDDSEVISIKDRVYMCKNRRDFISVLGGVEDELTTLFRTNSIRNPYGMRDYTPTSNVQAESTKNNLKKLIRESLLEIKENKKKSILGESKIVKVRLSIISENVVLKTKKQKDKFFDELLSEMAYLNSQGFDKQVINEGFWETLKGLFGHAPDGIMEYFKEYMAKWLVNNLTPMDSEGWFGNMIITGIGNLPIGDIPKLTDCNYLTKWISKTAAEGTVRKLTHEKGLDGPFYDILRNSIVDMLDETSLGSKIEEALGSFICPLLGGVKNKMEATTDKLKQKALATS